MTRAPGDPGAGEVTLLLRRVAQGDASARGPLGHPTLARMQRTLADAYARNGDPDGAARWRLE